MTPNHLHIWPRVTFMMIALPNQNGSWTVTLFMPFAQFAKITNRRDLLEFFGENFADALPLIGQRNLIQTYFNSEPQPLVSIKVPIAVYTYVVSLSLLVISRKHIRYDTADECECGICFWNFSATSIQSGTVVWLWAMPLTLLYLFSDKAWTL